MPPRDEAAVAIFAIREGWTMSSVIARRCEKDRVPAAVSYPDVPIGIDLGFTGATGTEPRD
ncbi:hypothetical protein WN73_11875 [Bradyrhizobium sp. CCBAU 45394]|nr:hypothetical protein [Bradyrhizobium sp. CCBAU 45394]